VKEENATDGQCPEEQPQEKRQTEDQPAIEGPVQPPGELGGPTGPEPTRFGDWEKGGRCSDF
jgi:hypothetical protein